MPRVFPIIIGSSAGGKTQLSFELAALLEPHGGAEIVSADAFQIYRGMDIGTAKPSPEERAALPHHLIDIREPTEPFSVDEWLALANTAIDDIRSRGATPIVVGGTHLYIKALLEGLFAGPEPDHALRAQLTALTAAERRAELARVDPAAAARIHPNDERRTIRALEVYRATGVPISQLQSQWDAVGPRADALLVALHWPAEAINKRINDRVRKMVEAGLVEEVRSLFNAGKLGQQASQALGYKQLIPCLEGSQSPEKAVERIKIETRRFAKNQRTWMRRLLAPARQTTVDFDDNRLIAPAPLILNCEETTPQKQAQVVINKLFESKK